MLVSFFFFLSHILSHASRILLFCENPVAICPLSVSVIRHLRSEVMDLFALSAFRWPQPIFWEMISYPHWGQTSPKCLSSSLHFSQKEESWGLGPMGRNCPNWPETTWLDQFSSVQSFSRVRLFATPWIAARQASLWRVLIFIILVAKRQGHGLETQSCAFESQPNGEKQLG